MPNHKLSPSCVAAITDTVHILAERRVRAAQMDFPLSHDKLQAAMLPSRWRRVILEMRDEGLAVVRSGTQWRVKVVHPGIPRAAVLRVAVTPPSTLLYCQETPTLDMNVLDAAEVAALVDWTNVLVRERRAADVTKTTAAKFLGVAPSVAHVVARWPLIGTLAGHEAIKDRLYGRDKDLWDGWKQKFRDAPVNLKPYRWAANAAAQEWYRANRAAMRLAEVILTSAEMLPAVFIEIGRKIRAELDSWDWAPGDPR